MSEKSDFDMIIEFAERKKKEGKEEGIKDRKKGWERFINRLNLGIMFAILAMPIGILMSIWFLKLLHTLQEQLYFR